MQQYKRLIVVLGVLCISTAWADVVVPITATAVHGTGQTLGKVTIRQTRYGLLLTPQLHGLTPGAHGFHIHVNPSCANAGLAAGGHFDPQRTGKHLGPYNDRGHLGDLPVLVVNKHGDATRPVLAPRWHRLVALKGHALMIHQGGDNYADQPRKLGGGGKRIACGVIK